MHVDEFHHLTAKCALQKAQARMVKIEPAMKPVIELDIKEPLNTSAGENGGIVSGGKINAENCALTGQH